MYVKIIKRPSCNILVRNIAGFEILKDFIRILYPTGPKNYELNLKPGESITVMDGNNILFDKKGTERTEEEYKADFEKLFPGKKAVYYPKGAPPRRTKAFNDWMKKEMGK